ncbi:aminotransferase class V-fold PLP-dependent enzyme [uncultured Varibaculum sp.]|uniref:aminotransferase class V-fold PLP-dependent enzyme n=1 Tax=uncultured Varibaculum sp. TaxID=413896 RepID=UPI00267502CC|nr:SufS family cysteine desulfurase [uncultured Varibaculum sp.]
MQSPFSDTELARLRADFPILSRTGRGGKPIVYLDAAATSQKPRSVIEAENCFYGNSNGAVHRGTHLLADESSQYFEDARCVLASFIGANPSEIVWTKNATEALNLVAYGLSNPGIDGGAPLIGKGDRVVTTRAEHHANLVPWQLLSQRTGCEFAYLDLDDEGRIDLETLNVITTNTKVVAVTHASNVSGAITDIAPIIQAAHAVGAWVVLDTCQSSAHMPLDIKALGADFACFSGHKMAGPTGIGALYGRLELLEQLPPFLAGGSMIADVNMDKTTFQPVPERFEAGSQAVAQIHAWAVALDYLQKVGMERIRQHELFLTQYLLEGLASVKGLRLLGSTDYRERVGLAAFDFFGIHPHDVGQVLDAEDVAIRVGHHCALPLHAHYGLRSSCRASLSLTSSREDIDRLIDGLETVRSFFKRGE